MDATAPARMLVPIKDAQTLLGGIGRTTIYELVSRGEIARVNIGRRSFITAASLDEYVGRLNETSTGASAL